MAFRASSIICILLLLGVRVWAIVLPSSYDVIWNEPGKNQSADSMPLGGGDIGINTWSENGTVLFYLAKSGAFDENNSLLKFGRIRLTLTPNPFDGGAFEQRLVLNDGYVRYTGNDNTTVKLWVDVDNPMVHIEVDSPEDISLNLSYENWRYKDRAMVGEERNQGSWGNYNTKVPDGTTYADNITFYKGGVLMSHRNSKLDIWNFQLEQQGLVDLDDQLYNPMRNNEFGLWVHSDDLEPGDITDGHYINTDFKAWELLSPEPRSSFHVKIAMYQNQTSSHCKWLQSLEDVARMAPDSQTDTISWWHKYWDRSYIIINEDEDASDSGFQVGKNYQLWRYLMGCNAKGEWPTKFNGGLWTYDPIYVNNQRPFTPDHRRWGGGTFTAQNQRLLYWPLLRTGDFDVMRGQFDFYKRATPNALIRAQVYQGLDAAFFLEQGDNTALSNVFEYNGQWYDRRASAPRPENFPDGEVWNVYLNHQQDTANEFADMILQAHIYSGFDVKPYLQFIELQLAWFDKYYQKQALARGPRTLTGIGGNESLIIYPGSGAETYKEAYNPASTVSGLRKLIADLLQVGQFEIEDEAYYKGYLARVPETPLRLQQGKMCIAPAVAYTRIQNTEVPQLYPVFPWGEYGLGKPNLDVALNTYMFDTETQSFHGNVGWKQDVIWLARMGVTANATALTEERFADSTVCKFPAFKGPNMDWTPDLNHYGSAAIGLHEQLIQTFVGDSIRLLPAWPDKWSARFKVWAPFNTTVEGVAQGGKVTELNITPESRASDVIYNED